MLSKLFIKYYPSLCRPYSVPMPTSEYARSDWNSVLTFLFLILIVSLLYKFGSLLDAILPSFLVIGSFATFLTNFKCLLLILQPRCTTSRLRRLPFGTALSLYGRLKHIFAGKWSRVTRSNCAKKLLPFGSVTFFICLVLSLLFYLSLSFFMFYGRQHLYKFYFWMVRFYCFFNYSSFSSASK